MLVYRAFIRVSTLLNSIVSCLLSLFFPFHALVDGPNDHIFLWDFMYFRSRFLQTHFNYRLNYRSFELRNANELHSLVARCGIWFEEHLNIDRCPTSNRQVNLYRLSRNTTTNKTHKTVVLIHGLFQSIDIFVCGGQSSIAAHLLSSGCDVWLLQASISETCVKERSVPATPALSGAHSSNLVHAEVSTALPVEEKTHLTSENLIAVAKFIDTYTNNSAAYSATSRSAATATAVCWVAHSTGCEAVLAALAYRSDVQAAATAELRRRTSEVVLLSPVLTLTHLNRHAGGNVSVNNTVLLHEVLLHSPQYAYALLGHDTALLSLQQWRDILTAQAYCNAVIAPLCRYTLGWSFGNIALHRRAELLPCLLHPTPTHALVSLLYASHGTHEADSPHRHDALYHVVYNMVYGAAANVKTLCRWGWSYSFLVLDASLRLAGWMVGTELCVCGMGRSKNFVGSSSYGVSKVSNGMSVPSSGKKRVNFGTAVPKPHNNSKHTPTATTHTHSNAASSITASTTSNNSKSTLPATARRSPSYTPKPRIVSFVGTNDPLCNAAELEQRLAALAEQYSYDKDVRRIDGYEHMDTLWADTASELVFREIT